MTRKLIIAVTAVLSFCLISTSAWAGSKQQHRWEGVAIGIGAAIVGSALINHHATGYPGGPPMAFSFNYREHHRHSARHHGHWKPHYYGHHNHWRPHYRGHHYRGHHPHRSTHGNWRKGSWKSHDRGHHGGQRSHRRGHGGRGM